MYLPIEHEAKLFLYYELTHDRLESLSNDLGNDFVHNVTTGNGSKIIKSFPSFFLVLGR